jgi:NADH-quinone oxidoreductase subunit M
VLAGVILKMGAYGLIRFSFELFPQAAVDLAPLLLVLAVIGIIYGAIVATMQRDMKRVIAYSSVAHMGFVVLGIFSLTTIGIDGAAFTMLSHPLTTGALFLVIGMLYERRHTREISAYRGIWKSAPVLGGMFLIALFAGMGLPGFSGFIGEFLSLLGTFIYDRPYAIVATFGVIFAAVYSLWAFPAFTGKPQGENTNAPTSRGVIVSRHCSPDLALGLYPKAALDRISRRSSGRCPTSNARATTAAQAARDRGDRSTSDGKGSK